MQARTRIGGMALLALAAVLIPGPVAAQTPTVRLDEAIDLALREHGGNVSKAAEMLGINRTTLYGRMDRLEGRE